MNKVWNSRVCWLALAIVLLAPASQAQDDWSEETLMLSEFWARSSDELRDQGLRKQAIGAALKGIPAGIREEDIERFGLAHLALYAAVRSEHLTLPIGNRVVGPIYGLDVSADGRRAVTRSTFDTGKEALELWDTQTGEPIATLLEGELGHHFDDVAFSNDGRYLAIAGRRGSLLLYDPADGRLIADLPAIRPTLPPPDDSPQFRSIRFNPSNTLLVTVGDYPPELKVWSLPDPELVFAFEGHHEGVFGLAGSVRTEVNASFADDTRLCVTQTTIRGPIDAQQLVAGTIDIRQGNFMEFHLIARPLTNLFTFYGGVVCSSDLRWAAVRYSDKDYVPYLDLVEIEGARPPRSYGQTFAFGTVFDKEGTVLALQTVERWEFLDLATGEMMGHHPGAGENFVMLEPRLFDEKTGEQVSQDPESQSRYGASKVWPPVPVGLKLIEMAYGELGDDLRAEVDAERIE